MMLETLKRVKVIPVASVDTVDQGLRMCEALMAADLPVAEITFRTSAAEAAISAVSKAFPEMLVGAGTILNTVDLARALNAGAKFAVAPGSNPKVISEAQRIGLPFYPGVATPTDIEAALELGCRILKFFPAGALGGAKSLKALSAPYAHTGVSFIPTGGVTSENLRSYLELKTVIAAGGSWMVASEYLKGGDWASVTKLAREAVIQANT